MLPVFVTIIIFKERSPSPEKMPTKVKFSDTVLSTGADGMPMVDAIIASFVFSEELRFRACGREIVNRCYEDSAAWQATGHTFFNNFFLLQACFY